MGLSYPTTCARLERGLMTTLHTNISPVGSTSSTSSSSSAESSSSYGGESSYQIHLGSLQDFSRELQEQISVLNTQARTLDGGASAGLPLGDFGEATNLQQKHAEALAQTQALLDHVRDAMTFAEQVTDTVANSYITADKVTAGELSRGASA